MIVPDWPTQYWYPIMMDLLNANPVILAQLKTLITPPFNPTARHPLFLKMKLLAILLSGDASLTGSFQMKLKKLSWNHGDFLPEQNTTPLSVDGNFFVVSGKKIVYDHL